MALRAATSTAKLRRIYGRQPRKQTHHDGGILTHMMSDETTNRDNGVNETHQSTVMGVSPGTGTCSKQPELGSYQATACRGIKEILNQG